VLSATTTGIISASARSSPILNAENAAEEATPLRDAKIRRRTEHRRTEHHRTEHRRTEHRRTEHRRDNTEEESVRLSLTKMDGPQSGLPTQIDGLPL